MTAKKEENKSTSYNLKTTDFNTNRRPTWCIGCGNYSIWNSLKKALVRLGMYPHQTLIVYGIGCSGNGTNFTKTYSFHALHGRALPVATGAKLANNELNIVVMTGDGDGVGIGGNHFMHTCRRNLDFTHIMHDNRIYGLTTGQTSPTSGQGFESKSTPSGALELPVNPVMLALASGATFVARGFSGEPEQLANIIEKAIKHKGFSFVDVLQPCVTFNKVDTYELYKEKTYKLEEENYNTKDLMAALKKSSEETMIPIGIFYQVKRKTYEGQLEQIKEKPLVSHDINNIDIKGLLSNYY